MNPPPPTCTPHPPRRRGSAPGSIWLCCLLLSGSQAFLFGQAGSPPPPWSHYPFVPLPAPSKAEFPAKMADLERRVQDHPEEPELRLELARGYVVQERYLEAAREYRAALDHSPDSPWSRLELAALYCRIRHYGAAGELLEPLLPGGEGSRQARTLLAFILQQEERLDQSDRILNEVLRLDPEEVYALHLSGLNRLWSNRAPEAAERFEKAVQAGTTLAETFFYLGSIYNRDGDTFPQAIGYLEQARQRAGPSAALRKELALAYLRAGRYGEAIEEIRQALAREPDSPEAHYILASIHRALGDAEAATRALEQYEELQTARAEEELAANRGLALYVEAVELLSKQRLDEAYRSFQQVLELHSGDGASYYGLAHIHYRRGETHRAIEMARKALEVNPYHPDYYVLLAESLERTGDPSRASEMMRAAVSLSPGDARLENYLGNLCLEAGDLQCAVTAYRRASQLEPHNPFFHLNLSVALKEAGNEDEADRVRAIYLELVQ